MKQKVALVLAGFGRVGRELCNRLKFFPDWSVKAVLRSDTQIINFEGIDLNRLDKFESRNCEVNDILNKIDEPTILVDVTADDSMLRDWKVALASGAAVVTANKLPLCTTLEECKHFFEDRARVGFEATVGAGLPVIHTLRNALFSKDYDINFEGCLSGTLAYIFDAVKRGLDFPSAVKNAYSKGYTEPDPREDLSAQDLARKALIMNRVLGGTLEMDDIKIQSLVPDEMQSLSTAEFIANMDELRLPMRSLEMSTPRLIASGDSKIASIELLDQKSYQLGNPTDNDFCLRSATYPDGLRIFGPGAGPEVTAMGLISDLILQTKTL